MTTINKGDKMKIDNGSAVMLLCEYSLVPATVAKIGRGKNIKVEIPAGHGLSAHTKYVPLEKVAEVDEKIYIQTVPVLCYQKYTYQVVCECWLIQSFYT